MSKKAMEVEDLFTFYREEIEPEFAVIWTEIVQNPEYSYSCDVRLECTDGRYCHSHQSLLSISSQCIRKAIDNYNNERPELLSSEEELVIGLPDCVPFEELDSIISYIYNGIVSVPESRVYRFLEVSRFLAIKGLEDINLVYEDQLDDSNHVLASNKSLIKSTPNYDSYLKEGEESETQCSSEESFDFKLNTNLYTNIKKVVNRGIPNVSMKSIGGQSLIATTTATKPRKVGLQGRKPQIGSPLITEDFKFGDRYQCKVCLRSYLWKKSLVRHYKDLHPNNVELVSE